MDAAKTQRILEKLFREGKLKKPTEKTIKLKWKNGMEKYTKGKRQDFDGAVFYEVYNDNTGLWESVDERTQVWDWLADAFADTR